MGLRCSRQVHAHMLLFLAACVGQSWDLEGQVPMQSSQWGAQTGPTASICAHADGQAAKSKSWPTSSHLQARRWDTVHVSPDRSWLQAPSYVPVWLADKGDASQSAASTVPGTCSQQACLVRPLPESRQASMRQTASLAQQQVFLPLRRIEAGKFLPTNRAALPLSRAPGHQGVVKVPSCSVGQRCGTSCHPEGKGTQGRLGHTGSHAGTTPASSIQKEQVSAS